MSNQQEREDLSVDDILSSNDIQYAFVPCPEIKAGYQMRVRSLIGDEVDEVYDKKAVRDAAKSASKNDEEDDPLVGLDDFRYRVLCLGCLNHGNDQPKFNFEKHRAFLGKKNAGWIGRCVNKILDLSGMSKRAKAALGEGSSAIDGAATPSGSLVH